MDVLKKKLTATEKQSEQMEQYRQQLEKLQVTRQRNVPAWFLIYRARVTK